MEMETYEKIVDASVNDIKNKLILGYAGDGFGMIQNTDSTMAFQRMIKPSDFMIFSTLCVVFSFLIFPIIFLIDYAAWGSRPTYFIFFEKHPSGKTIVKSNDKSILTLE